MELDELRVSRAQLAQRSQDNGGGVSSGRCEVVSIGLCRSVCVCIYRVYECVVVCEDSISSVFECVHTAEPMFFHQFIMQFLLRVMK